MTNSVDKLMYVGLMITLIGVSVSALLVDTNITALKVLAECEKTLPRDQECELIAIPKFRSDK